jgi:CBS domain-containing protein
MPIVDGCRVIGIVTSRDMLRVLARADADIAVDVRHQLANYGGTGRWAVEVHDGAVTITDALDDVPDRHVAMVLAEAVHGVTAAHVAQRTSEH